METKNEQQKQNLVCIFMVLVLVIICSLLFLQNRKIEKITTMINMNYDPYEFGFRIRNRPNNDIYSVERRINEKFLEFAREMEELKQVVGNAITDDLSLDNRIRKPDDEVMKKNKITETDTKVNSKKNIKDNKTTKKSKNQEKHNRNSQFKVRTNYNKDSKEYEVEVDLPNDFNMEDISVSLKNSVLRIKIEKEFNGEDKNSSYHNYNSFYQSFTIPKTRATTKDIIKNIEDGKLEIKVPIK